MRRPVTCSACISLIAFIPTNPSRLGTVIVFLIRDRYESVRHARLYCTCRNRSKLDSKPTIRPWGRWRWGATLVSNCGLSGCWSISEGGKVLTWHTVVCEPVGVLCRILIAWSVCRVEWSRVYCRLDTLHGRIGLYRNSFEPGLLQWIRPKCYYPITWGLHGTSNRSSLCSKPRYVWVALEVCQLGWWVSKYPPQLCCCR